MNPGAWALFFHSMKTIPVQRSNGILASLGNLVILFVFLAAVAMAVQCQVRHQADPTLLARQSQAFMQLKHTKGHWQNGNYNDMVDSFQGPKHRAMMYLGRFLGQPGTDLLLLIELMGEPDRVDNDVPIMPGAFLGPTFGQEGLPEHIRLHYYWRGPLDYLWFDIDTRTRKVMKHGWVSPLTE